jgi:hypothetical protein
MAQVADPDRGRPQPVSFGALQVDNGNSGPSIELVNDTFA